MQTDADTIACYKRSCLDSPSCTAMNVNLVLRGGTANMRACTALHIVPHWPGPEKGWSGYHMASLPRPPVPPPPPPPPPLAAGFSFPLHEAGFGKYSRVAVRDLIARKDLGTTSGERFVTKAPLPWHGTMLLRLTWDNAKAYPPLSEEL